MEYIHFLPKMGNCFDPHAKTAKASPQDKKGSRQGSVAPVPTYPSIEDVLKDRKRKLFYEPNP